MGTVSLYGYYDYIYIATTHSPTNDRLVFYSVTSVLCVCVLCVCVLFRPAPAFPLCPCSDSSALVTKSSIFFKFNCSWFSDVNGAVKFFTVIVTESDGTGAMQL